ncbi:MAG: tail fiber domain-containing protein [Candidatus Paceibacterota bacterium]
MAIVFLLFFSLQFFVFSSASAATGVPQIMSYQGRLANSAGDLVGGTGAIYSFKFSLWDNATVGSGSRVWPATSPTAFTSTVRQGLFNVNIGDTDNGYPDALNYDFSQNNKIYLQIEVSSDGITYETLGPRQPITSAPFAQVAGSVYGSGISTMGGLVVNGNSTTTSLAIAGLANTYLAVNGLGQVIATTSPAFSFSELDPYYSVASSSLLHYGTTSDALTEGLVNKFYTQAKVWTDIVASSTFQTFSNYWTKTGDDLSYLTGDVSVGTSSSASTFNIQALAGASALNIASSTGASMFTVASNGNVGIGTENPTNALVVNGTASASLFLGQVRGTLWLSSAADIGFNRLSAGVATVNGTAGSSALRPLIASNFFTGTTTTSSQVGILNIATTTGDSYLFVGNTGLVGLGTTTPDSNLNVFGTTNTFLRVASSTNQNIFVIDGSGDLSATGNLAMTGAVTGSNLNVTNWNTAYGWGDWATGVWASSTLSTLFANASTAFSWGDHSLLGYLTNALFDTRLAATTSLPNLATLAGLTDIGSASATTTIGGSSRFIVGANGNVGIGTSTPSEVLSVVGNSIFGTRNNITNFASSFGITSYSAIIGSADTDKPGLVLGDFDGTKNRRSAIYLDNSYPATVFRSTYSTGGSPNWVFYNGSVGIGTTTPLAKLDIAGTLGSTADLFNVSSTTEANVVSSLFKIASDGKVTVGATLNLSALSDSYLSVNSLGQVIATSTPLLSFDETDPYYTAASSTLLRYGNSSDVLTEGVINKFYTQAKVWDDIVASTTFQAFANYWTKVGNDLNYLTGNVAVGTTTFDGTNPEKFLVDAGNTSSVNGLVVRGSIDNYFQMNIKNSSGGTNASTDIVATGDTGNEGTGFIDMGINSSGYTGGIVGLANDTYLYGSSTGNMLIGNASAGKNLIFFTNGANGYTNEKMRISSSGFVGIGNWSPTQALEVGSTTAGLNGIFNATLGAELTPTFDAGNWTGTNGWSATGSTLEKVTNATAGTITPSGAGATPAIGTTYQITITTSAKGAAAVTYTYGGVTGTTIVVGTFTDYITAVTAGKLIITGAISSTATITGVSIKALTNNTGDLTVFGDIKLGSRITNPNGTLGLEISPTGAAVFGSTVNAAGRITGAGLAAGGTVTGVTSLAHSLAITGTVPTLYVSTDGYILTAAASTGVTSTLVPLSISPRIRQVGQAWDIDSAANVLNNYWSEVIAYPGTTTVNSKLSWFYSQGAMAAAAEYQAPEIMNYYNGSLNVLGSTYGDEVLTNGALATPGAEWSVSATGFTLNGSAAVYVHHASGGTLTQPSTSFDPPVKANRWYRFTWTSSALNTTARAYIDPTGISAERVYLRGTVVTAGTYTVTFKTNSNPGNFIITADSNSSGDGFTLDDLSLVEVNSGNVVANGLFTGGGTEGLKIDNNGLVGIGTSTPDSELNIFGNNTTFLRVASSTNQNIFVIDSSGNVSLSGNLTLGNLNGPLQAINGLVSATSSIGSGYLSGNVMLEGENISLLNNDANYLAYGTSSDALTEGLVNEFYTQAKVWTDIIASSTFQTFANYWTKTGDDLGYLVGNVGIGTTTNMSNKLTIDGGDGSISGLEIRNLGTATKGIDLSNSGLSGATDYPIYIGASQYWTASNVLRASVGSFSSDHSALDYRPFGTNSDLVYWLKNDANKFSFENTAGLEVASISSAGVASTTGLQVNGNSFLTGTLSIGTTSVDSTFSLQALAGVSALNIASSTGASMLYVSNSGYVGIGNNDPSYPLTVTGDIVALGTNNITLSTVSGSIYAAGGLVNNVTANNSRVRSPTTGAIIDRNVADSNPALTVNQAWNGAASTGDLLRLQYDSVNKIVVDYSGNMGIGTTTPTSKLVVSGASTSPLAYFADDNNNSLQITSQTLGLALEGHTTALGPDISFVGVKDSFAIINSPSASVYEALGATNTIGMSFSNSALNVSADITFEDVLGQLKLRSDYIELDSANGVTVTDLNVNGAVYSNNGVLTNVNPSSRTYKNNIVDTNLNIDALLGLQIKSFNWNKSGQADFGLIAEEVKSAVPELYLESNGVKGYRADHLPFYLLQIAQRQEADLNELRSKLDSLTGSSVPISLTEEGLIDPALFTVSTSSLNISTTTEELSTSTAFSILSDRLLSGLTTVKDLVSERMVAMVGLFDYVKSKLVETDVLRVQKGMEIKDSATGEIYCVLIVNGEWKKTKGQCSDTSAIPPLVQPDTPVAPPLIIVETGSSTPSVDTSTSTSLELISPPEPVTTVEPNLEPAPVPEPSPDPAETLNETILAPEV